MFKKIPTHTITHRTEHEGSALLVALIIMGILMTVAIGMSELLIRSVRDSRQLINRTTAWYRAEAGIETALLKVTHNPPGYEEIKERDAEPVDDAANFSYEIKASSSLVPELPYENAPVEESFSDLQLGQTVNIPLFSGTNPDEGIKHFKFQYRLIPELRLQGGTLREDLDVVRWKIFGRTLDGTQTEVINGLAPEHGELGCVGTDVTDCYPTGKYFKKVGEEVQLTENEFISSFLESHTQNFLVVTNMVNVDLIGGTLSASAKRTLATLKYKVVQLDDQTTEKLTLPTITVTADGYARDTKQSIDVEIDRERALPVFNYALYRTKE